MKTVEYCAEIVKELGQATSGISDADAEKMVEMIEQADRIFVAGAGRSGFMARGFTMRLMHMGRQAYMVGETSTPSISANDLLVIASGSGETGSLAGMANKAKQIGCKLAHVTIVKDSSIGRLADVVITIKAPSSKVKGNENITSIQPMGSMFEQSVLIYLDAVIARLMERQGITSDEMFERHANLE